MELAIKYQQDTTQNINQLKPVDNIGQQELKIDRTEILLRPIQVRNTNALDTVPLKQQGDTPKISRQALLKYRWWQQEQKLLVGNSRYINANDKIEVTNTEQKVDDNLVLPNRKILKENTDWLTILLIFILILFATVRTNYSGYISNLFKSIFNYSTSSRMFQERNYSVAQGAFRLEIYFYLTFSVFLFQIFRYFRIDLSYNNIVLYLFSLALVLVYFFGKKFIYKFLGIITEGENETGEFLFNVDNTNRIIGLLLFPLVLLIIFYPGEDAGIPVFLGIMTVLFLYFVLLFRGIMILMKKQFSIFYLFLYFCTLEFLPLVLLYKIVVL